MIDSPNTSNLPAEECWHQNVADSVVRMEEIGQQLSAHGWSAIRGNRLMYQGLLREVEMIGENSKKVPRAIQERNPQIPWKRMRRCRNDLAHYPLSDPDDVIKRLVHGILPILLHRMKRLQAELVGYTGDSLGDGLRETIANDTSPQQRESGDD